MVTTGTPSQFMAAAQAAGTQVVVAGDMGTSD